ncbi:MAG: TetR/AcrR family transcriptional regulator [Actinomycetota bacterium]
MTGRAGGTRRALLEAANHIIRTEGTDRLTLDRVAAIAGVSKGGLLYHFGTKRALLAALLEETLADADDELERLAQARGDRAGAFAHAYLDFVRDRTHTDATAAGVLAAAALEDGDLDPARERFATWQSRLIEDDCITPDDALLTRVIGDGLWLIDLFDLAPPTDAQREALLDRVAALVDETAR